MWLLSLVIGHVMLELLWMGTYVTYPYLKLQGYRAQVT
jgi:hypothetical protein